MLEVDDPSSLIFFLIQEKRATHGHFSRLVRRRLDLRSMSMVTLAETGCVKLELEAWQIKVALKSRRSSAGIHNSLRTTPLDGETVNVSSTTRPSRHQISRGSGLPEKKREEKRKEEKNKQRKRRTHTHTHTHKRESSSRSVRPSRSENLIPRYASGG